ncbi:hypothetical protein C8J56DRAFT_1163970 [Mycena floridula]|nr:hypothetical protein C8J56DRAFT_1163970 [Mycena floridula]
MSQAIARIAILIVALGYIVPTLAAPMVALEPRGVFSSILKSGTKVLGKAKKAGKGKHGKKAVRAAKKAAPVAKTAVNAAPQVQSATSALGSVKNLAKGANEASGKSGGPVSALGLPTKFDPKMLLGIRDFNEGAIDELD